MAILSNASAPQQQLGNALEALRYLVEPVDNANSESVSASMAAGVICNARWRNGTSMAGILKH